MIYVLLSTGKEIENPSTLNNFSPFEMLSWVMNLAYGPLDVEYTK